MMEAVCLFDHVNNQIPNSYTLGAEKASYIFALDLGDDDCWVEKRTYTQLLFLERDFLG